MLLHLQERMAACPQGRRAMPRDKQSGQKKRRKVSSCKRLHESLAIKKQDIQQICSTALGQRRIQPRLSLKWRGNIGSGRSHCDLARNSVALDTVFRFGRLAGLRRHTGEAFLGFSHDNWKEASRAVVRGRGQKSGRPEGLAMFRGRPSIHDIRRGSGPKIDPQSLLKQKTSRTVRLHRHANRTKGPGVHLSITYYLRRRAQRYFSRTLRQYRQNRRRARRSLRDVQRFRGRMGLG